MWLYFLLFYGLVQSSPGIRLGAEQVCWERRAPGASGRITLGLTDGRLLGGLSSRFECGKLAGRMLASKTSLEQISQANRRNVAAG